MSVLLQLATPHPPRRSSQLIEFLVSHLERRLSSAEWWLVATGRSLQLCYLAAEESEE